MLSNPSHTLGKIAISLYIFTKMHDSFQCGSWRLIKSTSNIIRQQRGVNTTIFYFSTKSYDLSKFLSRLRILKDSLLRTQITILTWQTVRQIRFLFGAFFPRLPLRDSWTNLLLLAIIFNLPGFTVKYVCLKVSVCVSFTLVPLNLKCKYKWATNWSLYC